MSTHKSFNITVLVEFMTLQITTLLTCVGALVADEWSLVGMDTLVRCKIAICGKLGIADITVIRSFIRVLKEFMTLQISTSLTCVGALVATKRSFIGMD